MTVLTRSMNATGFGYDMEGWKRWLASTRKSKWINARPWIGSCLTYCIEFFASECPRRFGCLLPPLRFARYSTMLHADSVGAMFRRTVLFLALAMAPLAGESSAQSNTGPPPNVVLIIADDQAWTDYSFMGHPPQFPRRTLTGWRPRALRSAAAT